METVASILYVGLDVHKDSIDIALAEPGYDSEVWTYPTLTDGYRLENQAGLLAA